MRPPGGFVHGGPGVLGSERGAHHPIREQQTVRAQDQTAQPTATVPAAPKAEPNQPLGALWEDIRSLGKQSLIYGAGLWATSAAGFVLVPLYVRRLSPHDYGLLEILNRTSSILSTFALAGMVLAVLRFYYLYDRPEERRRVISSALAFSFLTSCLIQSAIVVFSHDLSRLLLGSPDYAALCVLAGFITIADMLSLLPGTLLRVREQVLLYTVFSVAKFALAITLNIWFVVGLGRGLPGVMEANLAASAAVGLAVAVYCLRAVGLRVSGTMLRAMLAFGLPVAAAGIPGIITENLDRYLLLHMRSAAEVGIYALSVRFGTLLSLLLFQPFGFIYSQFMFKVADRPDASRIYGKVTTVVTALGVWLTVALATFAPDIVSLVSPGKAYALSGVVAPVLLIGYLFYGVSPLLEVGIYLQRKTLWKPAIVAVQAVACTVLLWQFVPRWGATGAAWALVGSEAVLCLCLYLVARRLFRISYEWPRLAALLAVLVAAIALGARLAGSPSHLGFVSRLGLVAGVALLVGATAVLRPRAGIGTARLSSFASCLPNLIPSGARRAARLAAEPLIRGAWHLDPGVLIVRYHSISDPSDPGNPISPGICTSPADFYEQMALLAAQATPVSLDTVLDAFDRGVRLPARPVVVTFDDGYADNCEIALPILRDRGIPAAFLITTGWTGTDIEPWFIAIRSAFSATRRRSWAPAPSDREYPLDCEDGRRAARRAAARILARLSLAEQETWLGQLRRELEIDAPARGPP